MIEHKQRKHNTRKGRCLANTVINKLPFELHLPGYQYCGAGTKLTKRLARGDLGINPLDQAYKEHDIAYSRHRENVEARNAADRVLADKAWKPIFAKDASIDEKAAAYTVTNAMKLKSKFGMGLKKKPNTTLAKVVKAASKSNIFSKNSRKVIQAALISARDVVKKAGGKAKVRTPRVLAVPSKTGGFLPFLIPLFAGLSSTGALAGGTAGIDKAINEAKHAKRQLEESRRHNKTMEAIALGKGH